MPSSYEVIHSKEHETVIGEFNTDELLNEENVTVATLPGLGSIKISIYSDEGVSRPHFHLLTIADEKVSCICLYEPTYFVHNGYTTVLNSRQRKQLDKILRKQYSKDNPKTIWRYMSDFWLDNNDEFKLYADRRNSSQPDYTKLDGFIRK